MRRSRFRYLGFLGLLGLLSLVKSNPGLTGFFGFFGFFIYARLVNDERLKMNTGRAATNAFVAAVLAFVGFTLYGALVPGVTTLTYAFAFAHIFAIQMLVFSLSLAYYER